MPKSRRTASQSKERVPVARTLDPESGLVLRCHPDDMVDAQRPARIPPRMVVVNMREHAISWLYHRSLISDAQYAAAEKLRADYERAGLVRMSKMQWIKTAHSMRNRSGSPAPDPSLAQIDAKRRFDAAIRAAGPGLADICWRLICANESLSVAEKSLGWPARSGRIVLGIALDRLADHYGLLRHNAGGASATRS